MTNFDTSGITWLDDMGGRSQIGYNRALETHQLNRSKKHKTFDGEPYFCELKNHPDSDKYFNTKEYIGYYGFYAKRNYNG